MNWIKNNPFIAGVAGITLTFCGILYFFSSKWNSTYEATKANFDESYQAIATAERMALFPNTQNRDGKVKSLEEFKKNLSETENLFLSYKSDDKLNLSPQEFTDKLKLSQQAVSEKFSKAKCEIPSDFFLGFENYSNQLAPTSATKLLSFQLDNLDYVFSALAESKPSKLIKVSREVAIEESSKPFLNEAKQVVRLHPVEVTFQGNEMTARNFINSLGKTKPHYFLIRCIRIENTKRNSPNTKDVKFETISEKTSKNEFDEFEGFDFGEDNQEESTEVSLEDDSSKTESKPKEDTSRILNQVLGQEELNVFIRFDIVEHLGSQLPSKLK